MNIHKLETVLHEMRTVDFSDLRSATEMVGQWADRIANAITEHLLAELGGGAGVGAAPDLTGEPGGHGWQDEDLK